LGKEGEKENREGERLIGENSTKFPRPGKGEEMSEPGLGESQGRRKKKKRKLENQKRGDRRYRPGERGLKVDGSVIAAA